MLYYLRRNNIFIFIPSNISTSFSRFDAFNHSQTKFKSFPTNSSIIHEHINTLKSNHEDKTGTKASKSVSSKAQQHEEVNNSHSPLREKF